MSAKVFYQAVNRLANKFGVDLRRFPTSDQRGLLQYLQKHNIKNCFDVGANTGQFAKQFRALGFIGDIYSFEPQKKAYEQLNRSASHDKSWHAYNSGLGDRDEQAIINISQNSVSSSILDIKEIVTNAATESKYVATEQIVVKRLDTFIKEAGITNNFFLKIDAQGFESKILEGATACFSQVYALQLELSLITLYEGEKLFDEVKQIIESRGFYLSAVENGLTDPQTHRLLQVDTIFLREIR